MASAALDCLVHHSYFIEIKDESYRQRQRKLKTGVLFDDAYTI
jgi:DNA replication protein DnaC